MNVGVDVDLQVGLGLALAKECVGTSLECQS